MLSWRVWILTLSGTSWLLKSKTNATKTSEMFTQGLHLLLVAMAKVLVIRPLGTLPIQKNRNNKTCQVRKYIFDTESQAPGKLNPQPVI